MTGNDVDIIFSFFVLCIVARNSRELLYFVRGCCIMIFMQDFNTAQCDVISMIYACICNLRK